MEPSQIAQLPPHQLKQILLFLYGYQTVEEKSYQATVEDNGVGFNGVDAPLLSSYAQQVIDGRELSEKQYTRMRLMLPKYHRQLSGDQWDKITIPEVRYVNGSKGTRAEQASQIIREAQQASLGPAKSTPVKQSPGLLSIDPANNGLMFKPNVYPSKQIKEIGFTVWKDGAWHQWSPKVYQSVVDAVKKLFGDIEVAPEVLEALAPKQQIVVDHDWLTQEYPSLHPFQKEAIQFTANHPRLLLALAPRLGKSVVSILAARVINAQRILVIAPLSLLRDWKNKILRWDTRLQPSDVAIVYKKNLPVPARWTVTNYDTLRLHPDTFSNTQWDLVIVDETLLLKNRKALRTQWVYEVINKKLPYSKKKQKEAEQAPQVSVFAGKTKPPKYVWFLSGAPTSRLYADLWAQLNILDPNQFTSYWRFAENYCINQPSQWTQYNLVANKPDAAERIKQDLSHIYYTRSHTDVTDMPPLAPENLGVPMSAYQQKMYLQMEDKFLAELEDDEKVVAPIVLAQMLRLVQIASNPLLIGGKDDSPKWDALVEMVQFEEAPIIVWTSFIDTVTHLEERLLSGRGLNVQKLTGATPQDERGKIVEAFQAGDVHVLIAHPAVGKYGLDLYNARSVIYLERGYNADDYYQSLMRVRFVDQKVAPHIVHLLSERKEGGEETIDHVIDQLLASRTDATKKLTTVGLRQLIKGSIK